MNIHSSEYWLARAGTKIHVIQPVEDLLHECCDDVRNLRVHDGILCVDVQEHLVQALLYRVRADELCSLRVDCLFKSALRSLMIMRLAIQSIAWKIAPASG